MVATPQVVDFTNVKDGGDGVFRPRVVPDGDYRATITGVEDHTSKAQNKGWVFTIVLEGRSQGRYPYYVTTDEKSAWKLRNLLIAAGMSVPAKKVKVDVNKLINKSIGVAMITEEFNDREKSVVDAVFPASDIQTASSSGGSKSGGSKASSSADEDDDTAGDDEDLDIEEI